MKVFTNKYPVLGMLTMDQQGSLVKAEISVEFEEGKVFKVVGVSFCDFVLECEGKTISVNASVFSSAFMETELDL